MREFSVSAVIYHAPVTCLYRIGTKSTSRFVNTLAPEFSLKF